MNILYYTWEEVTKDDVVETLMSMGNTVEVVKYKLKDYLSDSEFISLINAKLDESRFDYIFSTNYIPVISKLSFLRKIIYISWVFDCPHITLHSEMIYNPYNFVFHFDKLEVMKFANKGVKNIFHMPLGVNLNRVNKLLKKSMNIDSRLINNEVAFMGTLREDNFYDSIKYIPPYCKGYVDAIMRAQLKIWGCDLIEEAMKDEIVEEMLKYIDFNLEKELVMTYKELLLWFLWEKTSNIERKEILQMLSDRFNLALYSSQNGKVIKGIEEKGILRYVDEMSLMFANTKINLNITHRGIQSGMSLRVLDVLVAGGFLITNYQPEIAEYFEDGKEVVMYQSREDLIHKVEYYLSHEEERLSIAKAGKSKVEKEFSYEMQLEKMFKIVQGRS